MDTVEIVDGQRVITFDNLRQRHHSIAGMTVPVKVLLSDSIRVNATDDWPEKHGCARE